MLRDGNLQDTPPLMTDDEEAVEHAECNRWHSEEIHGRNCFPMVSKEDQPALALLRVSRRSRFIQREMVLSESSKPSMRSSPCIRGALPTWGSQRPCGRSIPEPPSASVSFQPAPGLWKLDAS